VRDYNPKTGIPLLIQRLVVLTLIGSVIGVFYFVDLAIKSLKYSDEELRTAELCKLPSDVLYNYLFVGRTNELGGLVSSKWLDIYYYGKDRDLALKFLEEFGLSDKFLQAEAKGFNLNLSDPRHPDQDILLTIISLKKNCSDSYRRSEFQERFKDFLQNLGLVTLFVFAAWVAYRFMNRP
jgi:hypothetical protein